MSLHNVLALKAARSLVHLVHRGGDWQQVFTAGRVSLGYVRSGAAWPVPDAILVDEADGSESSYCALEFKPPQSSKGECVRGLGQVTTYLADYDCAALIVPDRADDGYDIGRYIAGLLSSPATEQARVGIYSYPVASSTTALEGDLELELLKPIGGLAAPLTLERRIRPERTFWAFWRDPSLQEMFLVLDRADRLAGRANLREESLRHSYNEYAALRTTDPQGRPRQKPRIPERDFKYHIAVTLTHLGLWEDDGTLSAAGRQLVHLGRVFGPLSAPFRDAFARQALLVGRHYELIKLVYEFQRNRPGHFRSAEEFAVALENYLDAEGLLLRLPGRRTTGSRRFFKGELTFWGIILRIIRKHGASYVVPDVGLDFDWPRIIDLLANAELTK
jgi:hypothetical protein